MTVIKIVKWYDANTVLWTGTAEDIRDAVRQAVAAGANLRGADLGGANLRGANLGDANLRDADLRGANLGDADLRDADLGDADLRDANLRGADLGDADLRDANLRGADLGGANLRGADLGGANLRGANLGDANLRDADLGDADLGDADLGDANLRDADLTPFRDDIWAVLSSAPSEVPALLAAIRDGKIDGTCYEGSCACLVGTIANARGCAYNAVLGLVPNSRRMAETWFWNIKPTDTPATNIYAQYAEQWIAEWLERMRAAFGPNAG